jgi:hypothetical protein
VARGLSGQVESKRDDSTACWSDRHNMNGKEGVRITTEPGLVTASLSAVRYEHDRSEPVIRLWDGAPRGERIIPPQVRGRREKVRR